MSRIIYILVFVACCVHGTAFSMSRSLSLSFRELSNRGVRYEGRSCDVVVRDVGGRYDAQGLHVLDKNDKGEFSPGFAVVVLRNDSEFPTSVPEWRYPEWSVRRKDGGGFYKSISQISNLPGLEDACHRVGPHSQVAFVLGLPAALWSESLGSYVVYATRDREGREEKVLSNKLGTSPSSYCFQMSNSGLGLALIPQMCECYVSNEAFQFVDNGNFRPIERSRRDGVRVAMQGNYVIQVSNLSTNLVVLKGFSQGAWSVLAGGIGHGCRIMRPKRIATNTELTTADSLISLAPGEVKSSAVALDPGVLSNRYDWIQLKYSDGDDTRFSERMPLNKLDGLHRARTNKNNHLMKEGNAPLPQDVKVIVEDF